MHVLQELIPSGHPNRPGTKLEALKAIIFHYTANDNPGATDTMNAKYFGRKYVASNGEFFEADGKTPFRYGSTHILADMNSVTMAIPTDETAWACGDRQLPYNNGYKGQMRVAMTLFNHRQNYRSVSIEICNNDAIKDSDEDWKAACKNAALWTIDFLRSKKLKVNVEKSMNPQEPVVNLLPNEILLLRHYDVTFKKCPKPFIDDSVAWYSFVRDIAAQV